MNRVRVRVRAGCFGALLLLTGTQWVKVASGQTVGPPVLMPDADPVMQRAFTVAAEGLDRFLQTWRLGAPTNQGFAVKVGIRQDGQTEYVWINDLSETADGSFAGRINNHPAWIRSVRFGERWTFKRADIVDWLYLDRAARGMVGNYTMCAVLSQQPREAAAAEARGYGLDCNLVWR